MNEVPGGKLNLKVATGGFYEEVCITIYSGIILLDADASFCRKKGNETAKSSNYH